MGEGIQVKAAAEFTIDARQHVLVEERGDAPGVIVSGVEYGGVLDEIEADKQRVSGLKRAAHVAEKSPGFLRLEIADGGPEKEHQLAPGQRFEVGQMMGVVGHDGRDAQAR